MSRESSDWYQQKDSGSRKFYFAYGANTNICAMRARCPKAEPIGKVVLKQHRLVSRFTMNVEECCIGGNIHGALWDITLECEAALDLYEGYPSHYMKKNITVAHDILGEELSAFTYVMASRWVQSPPATVYRALVEKGYRDFSIRESQLLNTISESERAYAEDIARICGEEYGDDEPWGRRTI